MAKMARPPRLTLDEPTLGLASLMTKRIFAPIPALVERGVTILIAGQNVHLTLVIAGSAHLVENGPIVLSGTGPELMARPEFMRAYLGL
jgi:branched-chain amino acid transport system ATP-binding protein